MVAQAQVLFLIYSVSLVMFLLWVTSEFRFIQDPNGIRDLDYGINENNNRLTTSYHINNFIAYINYLSKSKII